MKKIIIILLTSITFSCTVSHTGNNTMNLANSRLEGLNRQDYKIENRIEHKSNFNAFWLLFFRFGPNRSEDFRREKSYIAACKSNKVDGIIEPLFVTKKIVVPLILVSYVNYTTTVTGKTFTINSNQ